MGYFTKFADKMHKDRKTQQIRNYVLKELFHDIASVGRFSMWCTTLAHIQDLPQITVYYLEAKFYVFMQHSRHR